MDALIGFPKTWGHDLLLVRADKWRHEHAAHFLLRDYQILDRWHAELALNEIARDRGGLRFLYELRPNLLYPFYPTHTPANGYEQEQENRRCLKELIEKLGLRHSPRGKPPEFARFYVCRRNRRIYATPSLPLPMPAPSKQPESSDPSPDLDWVTIQFVDDAGVPMANETYEVTLADGSTQTGTLDANGLGQLSGIVAGSCAVSFPGFKPRLAG
jgi:hypothetical protein